MVQQSLHGSQTFLYFNRDTKWSVIYVIRADFLIPKTLVTTERTRHKCPVIIQFHGGALVSTCQNSSYVPTLKPVTNAYLPISTKSSAIRFTALGSRDGSSSRETQRRHRVRKLSPLTRINRRRDTIWHRPLLELAAHRGRCRIIIILANTYQTGLVACRNYRRFSWWLFLVYISPWHIRTK